MTQTSLVLRIALEPAMAAEVTPTTGAAMDRVYPATVLKPGVYVPGIGNGDQKRIYFPLEFLERRHASMDGKKVDLEHSTTIEDEVGFARNPRMEGDKMRADLVLQATRARFIDALAFVEGRIAAKQVPEVSVEIVKFVLRDATPDEHRLLGATHVLVDGEFDGVAILTKGACSAEAGCGIGLEQQRSAVLALCPTSPGASACPATCPKFAKKRETTMGNEGTPGGDAGNEKARADELAKKLKDAEERALQAEKKAEIAEKAELERISNEVLAAAQKVDPKATIETVTGSKEPTKAMLEAARRALQLQKPAEPEDKPKVGLQAGQGAGRVTDAGGRDSRRPNARIDLSKFTAEQRLQLARATVRERWGLSPATLEKVPMALRRNGGFTDGVPVLVRGGDK